MMIIIIIIIRKGKIEKRQTRYMLNFKMKSRRIYLSFYILKSFWRLIKVDNPFGSL